MAGAWKSVSRLLCVRLDNIGNVLLSTPAVRAFRDSLDSARITMLALPASAPAARLVPEVDEVLEYSADERRLVDALAERQFDAAAIFTVRGQSPLPAARLCARSGIPLRLAHGRDPGDGALTDWLPEPGSRIRHEVRRQLELAAAVDCVTTDLRLSFAVPPGARRQVRERLRAFGTPLVVVHPGTSAGVRRYPADSLARAVDLIAERTACEALVVGSAEDAPFVSELRALMRQPTHAMVGELSLAEFGALVAEADLLVSNESGPAHIAAALGTPVVDLYALSHPQYTSWQVPSRILYDDCEERLRITPETVAEAARELLEIGA